MSVTTPARTALDLACRNPVGKAVAAIDSLARATHLKMADVELLTDRYKADAVSGEPVSHSPRRPRRGIARETWLRLLLIRAGFPPPTTQIPVYDEYGQLVAVIDMGWEHIKVGVDYEGDHHWMNRRRFYHDIRRAEAVTESGGSTCGSLPRTPKAASSAEYRRPGIAESEAVARSCPWIQALIFRSSFTLGAAAWSV
ncbi:hypothetical protein I553_5470 [Mycobacterium xenopi 4042]|uniref:Uncharacterized protein n=1 Tax=Mycobacterium xenopi 4042 TaxID=1299334 RepID=X7ZUW4_MYCXE|nr:hypothetical protein I553_5470 [Mycobacterium xenopi 4042]